MSADPLLAALEEVIPVDLPCKLCRLMAQMPDERREGVKRALTSKIASEPLAVILRSHGYDVARWSIQKHRNEGHE